MAAHYPTPQHAGASAAIANAYARDPEIEAVLLTNSCARGRASPDSCLDVAVLLCPEALAQKGEQLEREWERRYGSDEVFAALRGVG
ncbi:MAG: nucleotidyltransferase domain-containing protein, partial [Chloroflexota bacterium]|nr:nucleotidyltransferase domain-containing protein [Chloroflexota bacterium]